VHVERDVLPLRRVDQLDAAVTFFAALAVRSASATASAAPSSRARVCVA
jgi:hypothetical protein